LLTHAVRGTSGRIVAESLSTAALAQRTLTTGTATTVTGAAFTRAIGGAIWNRNTLTAQGAAGSFDADAARALTAIAATLLGSAIGATVEGNALPHSRTEKPTRTGTTARPALIGSADLAVTLRDAVRRFDALSVRVTNQALPAASTGAAARVGAALQPLAQRRTRIGIHTNSVKVAGGARPTIAAGTQTAVKATLFSRAIGLAAPRRIDTFAKRITHPVAGTLSAQSAAAIRATALAGAVGRASTRIDTLALKIANLIGRTAAAGATAAVTTALGSGAIGSAAPHTGAVKLATLTRRARTATATTTIRATVLAGALGCATGF
jgi:hypothetical protein